MIFASWITETMLISALEEMNDMSYSICYDDRYRKRKNTSTTLFRRMMLTAICFLFFLILVYGFWEEGSRMISTICFSGDIKVFAEATQSIIEDVYNGMTFPEAVHSFCKGILYEPSIVR